MWLPSRTHSGLGLDRVLSITVAAQSCGIPVAGLKPVQEPCKPFVLVTVNVCQTRGIPHSDVTHLLAIFTERQSCVQKTRIGLSIDT